MLAASVQDFQLQKSDVVAEKAIRPVGALHLTLGVMSLDQEKLEAARQLLDHTTLDTLAILETSQSSIESASPTESTSHTAQESGDGETATSLPSTLSRPISPPEVSPKARPLRVSMKSLESMHAAHKTSILYVTPEDPTNRLFPFCDTLRRKFLDAGFLIDDNRPLKLHATIVNTIYAKGRRRPNRTKQSSQQVGNPATSEYGQEDRSSGHGPNADAPLKIDATELLEKYKDYVWAESFTLDRVAICEMGAKKILNDEGEIVSEEYKEIAIVRLPCG